MTDADEPGTLWVQSDVTPDGTYVVGLHYGPDRAWVLTRDEAIQHATTVLAQVERAEHDAAVIALLHKKLGMPLATASEFVAKDIRVDRPPLPDVSPITLVPGVSHRTLRPFLRLELDGEGIGQWDLDGGRQHAVFVLQTVEAVESDARLHRALVGLVGMDEGRARAVVGDIANHRESQ